MLKHLSACASFRAAGRREYTGVSGQLGTLESSMGVVLCRALWWPPAQSTVGQHSGQGQTAVPSYALITSCFCSTCICQIVFHPQHQPKGNWGKQLVHVHLQM